MKRGVALLAAVGLLAGCGGGESSGGSSGTSGTLTVFAAASLADVFTELGEELEETNPGLDVRYTFAGSSALATQLVQGAPADVFAAANEAQMAVVTGEGLAEQPDVFAANVLQIAVPAGNPAGVTGLRDLAREELAIALCAPEVPCGEAAEQVLAAAGVTAAPDTLEQDVRAVATKVRLGEVDAGLVYASDVAGAGGDVEGIPVPEAEEVVNEYPVCVLDGAPNPDAARAFVDLLLSERGRRALADAGFREP
ncbi:molybdate ABC transporter substrate-binding protein [Blastococcus sp. CCUG 61487]|uniref:molybdate ABC transporter substrate-binding protein n=1 Tax=Blastococcus sp. CCUG 61487 TaxID=1840703 RepID=UPI0010BFFC37|nr:molybdate ABC transporter substrate-binding protein [Blastococcus sp. CCUG 61487]TKJ22865.1 molybdate-binding protein [Blastococcus sp. CCUG 61487]